MTSFDNYLKNNRILWLFNIGVEQFWNETKFSINDETEDFIVSRMAELCLLLCKKEDLLILREYPDENFLEFLRNVGFETPQILKPHIKNDTMYITELILKDNVLQAEIKACNINQDIIFIPFGVSKLEEELASACMLTLIGPNSEISEKVNNKIFNREISKYLGLKTSEGSVCENYDEMINSSKYLFNDLGFEKVVIKDPYGASGKGLYIMDDINTITSFSRKLARKNEKKWLVEGWYKKNSDINYQIFISEDGKVENLLITEQLVDESVYKGSTFPVKISSDKSLEYKDYGKIIGRYLYGLGYRGIASIDSIIDIEGKIIPIIEINARLSLSTYLYKLTHIFNGKKIMSKYLRLLTNKSITFKHICNILNSYHILYDMNLQEGVLVYVSSTLPSKNTKIGDIYLGRLFVLIIGKNQNALDEYESALVNCFKDFNLLKKGENI